MVDSRILEFAECLREIERFKFPVSRDSDLSHEYSREVSIQNLEGREFSATVNLRPRETLVCADDKSAYAIVGDCEGNEEYLIRIYAATQNGVKVFHQESPVSPRVHLFEKGFLWVRRNISQRPYSVFWWNRECDHPVLLFEKHDCTCRVDLRSVGDGIAILTSRGPEMTDHWIISGEADGIPVCRPLISGCSDADAVVWNGKIVVLDRELGRIRICGSRLAEALSPPGFTAEHIHASGDSIFVIGRYRGRQAAWLPMQGSEAIWIAPPAGKILPSSELINGHPVFLVSSPIHKPQTVNPCAHGELAPISTGRADVSCIIASSDDNTPIRITTFLPPSAGPHSLVVHVYGAYGISLEGHFDPFTDDLLSRGIGVAFCHVRGGGENGPDWHKQATGMHRIRSLEDLLACLKLLRSHPAVAPGKIILTAASAGGLTAALACLREPTWLRGLYLVHPFVDPLSTLTDPNAKLATTDWAEFGDPRHNLDLRTFLKQHSPMKIVQEMRARSCPLPPAWIRAAHHDSRVDSTAVKRFSQLYRRASLSTKASHVTFRFTGGGHIGGQSAEMAHEENLLAHAWLLDLLDVPLSEVPRHSDASGRRVPQDVNREKWKEYSDGR